MSGSLRLTRPPESAVERLRAGHDLVQETSAAGLAAREDEDAAATERLEGLEEEMADVIDRDDADERLFRDAFGEGAAVDNDAEAFGEAPEAVAPQEDVYAGPAMTPNVAAEGNELRVQNTALGAHVNWKGIYSLPGYGDPGPRGEAIRHLGRSIFRTMATFAYMEEHCRERRVDPLGQIRVLSHTQGRSTPAELRQVNEMAAWIARNGDIIDAGEIDFGMHARSLQGYRPQIIAAMTDTDSFIMVRETYDTGAPVNATYIYSWKGGKLDLQNRPIGFVAAPPRRPQLEARPQPAARQRQAAAPAPAQRRAPVERGAPETAGRSLFVQCREAGYEVRPSAEGPCLRKLDGDEEITLRARGPLMLAREFVATRASDGHEITITTAADLEELQAPSRSMRP